MRARLKTAKRVGIERVWEMRHVGQRYLYIYYIHPELRIDHCHFGREGEQDQMMRMRTYSWLLSYIVSE